jgi:hypothetical protein
MSLVISNLDLEMTHSFNPNDKTEIHEHWVTMAEWHEELGNFLFFKTQKRHVDQLCARPHFFHGSV